MTAVTTFDPAGSSADRSPTSRWVLGLSMAVGNVLGYAFVLLVSRGLGPAQFGAFTAVNTTALFLTLPAGAFQIVVAARQVRAGPRPHGVGLALAVGAAMTGLTLLATPWLTGAYHLASPAPLVLVALMLPAFFVTGAAQGLLLGHGRLGALAVVYLAIAVTRVAAALAATVLETGVTGVFACLLVAAWVHALLGLALCAPLVSRWRRIDTGLLRELLTSNGTLAVLLAMTSTDLLLARHLLAPDAAGAYAFAALFGKVVLWGTQFVALAAVPGASAAREAAAAGEQLRSTLRALGLVLVLGAGVTVLVGLVPDLAVSVGGGPQYADAGGLLVPFALVGTTWAMCQVLLLTEVAGGGHRLTLVALGSTAAAAGVVWFSPEPTALGLVVAYGTAAAAVVLLGVGQLVHRARAAR